MDRQLFMTTPLLRSGLLATREQVAVSGIPNCLHYCVHRILHAQFTDVAAGR